MLPSARPIRAGPVPTLGRHDPGPAHRTVRGPGLRGRARVGGDGAARHHRLGRARAPLPAAARRLGPAVGSGHAARPARRCAGDRVVGPARRSGCRGGGCCSRRTPEGWRGCSASPSSTGATASGRSWTPSTSTSAPRAPSPTSTGSSRAGSRGSRTTACPDDIPNANWPVHIAGHPPGALGFFVVLDRIGLGSGSPAGIVVTLLAASTALAVMVTLRLLGAEVVARRAAPFLVFGPAAIWQCVSADAMFAAVAAWGIAALAAAAVRRSIALVAGRRAAARLRRDAVLRPAAAGAARRGRAGGRAQLAAPALGGAGGASPWWRRSAPSASGGGRRCPALHDRYWAGVAREPAAVVLVVGQPRRPRLQRRPDGVRRGSPRSGGRPGEVGVDAARVVRWLAGAAVADGAAAERLADEQGRGRAHLAAVRAVAADRLRAAARTLAAVRASASRWCWRSSCSTCSSPAGDQPAAARHRRHGAWRASTSVPIRAVRSEFCAPPRRCASRLPTHSRSGADGELRDALLGRDLGGEAELGGRRARVRRRCGGRRRGGSRRSPRAPDRRRPRRAARRRAGSGPACPSRRCTPPTTRPAGRPRRRSRARWRGRRRATCTKSRIWPPSSKTRGAWPCSSEERKIAATPE